MLFRQQIETVTPFVEFLGFLQNLIRGHGIRGFPGVFEETGPAFRTTAPLLHLCLILEAA